MFARLAVLVLPSLLLLPVAVHAEWPTVPADAVEITPSATMLRSVEDGVGGAHFAWYNGNEVRALRVDATGLPAAGWPGEGVLVATTSTLLSLAIGFDPTGGVYVGWTTQGFDEDVWLQHLAANGTTVPGWPAGGWQFSTGRGDVELTRDQSGGVYAVWPKYSGIAATRIQANGTTYPGWLPNGKVVFGSVDSYTFVADGQGGCYFVSIANDRVRVDRRDPAGALVAAWTSDALNSGTSWHPLQAVADGAGGVVVGWSWQADAGVLAETGLTRIGANGAPAAGWPAGGSWLALSPGGEGCLRGLRVDDQGSIFPTTTASNTTRAWRLTLDGAQSPGWPSDGAVVPGPMGFCTGSDLLWVHPDGQGGIYYSFITPSGASDVRVGRLDGSGSVAAGWPVDGLVVRSSLFIRRDLKLVPNATGGVIASWRNDDRTGTPLPAEANHVNPDGTLGPAQSVGVDPGSGPNAFAFALPRPNPALSSASFTLELPEESPVSIAAFDLHGRLVQRIAGTTLPAGVHDFSWNLEDRSGVRVRPGVYLIRAAAAGGAATRSLIVTE